MIPIPEHPIPYDPGDFKIRMSDTDKRALLDAINTKEAKQIGRSVSPDDRSCSWEVYEWSSRYFVFLNDNCMSEPAWEVTEEGAKAYCD